MLNSNNTQKQVTKMFSDIDEELSNQSRLEEHKDNININVLGIMMVDDVCVLHL